MNPTSPILPEDLRRPAGLYDPQFDHDACGVGMVCSIHGEKSHAMIRDGLQILENLTHRGACGCDETTGDGAGILIQLPHRFLRKAAAEDGVTLPQGRPYGCGMVFLPPDEAQQRRCMALFGDAVGAESRSVVGWRRVPTHSSALGELARQLEPAIFQVFVACERGEDVDRFERVLYLIRKRAENAVRATDLPDKQYFHVASLSSRTLVYKGMLLADQMAPYFPDLAEDAMASAMAVVHQRYSTNTFPTWDLAQPFRFLCHNGEINTVRGNRNWMSAREPLFHSDRFGEDIHNLFPIAVPGSSDSAALDNALELLSHGGRSLPHSMMMLIPEAWQNHGSMSDEKRAFYEYHAGLMEPWDGPAAVVFSDGRRVGAVLDRNGLRPGRYTVTTDGRVIMASETGVLPIPGKEVLFKGRLQPGRMFLVDMDQGRIVEDDEIKGELSRRQPYRHWLDQELVRLEQLPEPEQAPKEDPAPLQTLQQAFGYSMEDLKIILAPMARDGKEPIGSMGDDVPLAILSRRPRLLYDYFKQLFAQVTNPPLDAIREQLVTSLVTTIGAEQNLLGETPLHCRLLRLERPVLTPGQLHRLRSMDQGKIPVATLRILYPVSEGGDGLKRAMEALGREAADAVSQGAAILILSDRGADREKAPIPALLAVAGVHHHLIRQGLRTRCGMVVETGEAREVHHFCCLIGYGAGAVVPYLAFRSIEEMARTGELPGVSAEAAAENYAEAACKGLLKVMSKMGISTLQSYRGAKIFECVGLNDRVIDDYFTGTPSRISGAGLDTIAREVARRYRRAYPRTRGAIDEGLALGGMYKWRRTGEAHQYSPTNIALLQKAVRDKDRQAWNSYTELVYRQNRDEGLIRGLFEFIPAARPIALEEVEPAAEIVKRFKTGAMSYGSISQEAHETLAVAMNRIGAKSNSGEGGEDSDRFSPDADGNWRNSAIKQVASGRFGVTSAYLASATDLQIKMAQGAKPGEGGQLPGAKVYPWIAKTRHATPHVGLISPPPHHDIYSIEDLAQLIHDLKNANPSARVNVKLVSEVGVGTVAAGVAKGKADLVLISSEGGGTGAAPLTSIKYAGLPWELGLAEAHQTLVANGLRERIAVECDGQLKTGRDVAVACLLGAEEFGFGTIALVALGCVMMRVCHLNTCPVGIATQDPELRKKFAGKPEHLINLMFFIAEDLRRIMADLGFRTVREMVGQVDRLNTVGAIAHWKAHGLDFSKILHRPDIPAVVGEACFMKEQDHGLEVALDIDLIESCRPALENGEPVRVDLSVRNVNRTVGTMLSYHITRRHGEAGLPEDTIVVAAKGSAGQSFCAFGAPGLTIHLEGDANDYFGKGLSGAKLSIRPPEGSRFAAEDNIVIGNVALYGATSGEAYIRGIAGERFCVRNSGAEAVVEGVGDHGCEYMTGGRVVILGTTGRNFAAGMSGGVAYVYDPTGNFVRHCCNREMVLLEPLTDPIDVDELHRMIAAHRSCTGSAVAERILSDWQFSLDLFVKVIPEEYKKALARVPVGR